MKEITREMVTNLNKELRKQYCPFIYRYLSGVPGSMQRTLPEHIFVDDKYTANIPVTNYFYEWLNEWFREHYDIELAYNNTGSICWAKYVDIKE